MTEGRASISQRWQGLQPSKTFLFWTAAGCVAATAIVGFTFGGWVTGGTAQAMAESSAQQARAELAAAICVERFVGAPQAQVQLVALKDITSSFARRGFIEDGGWATMPGMEAANRDAAALCAAELIAIEELEPNETAAAPETMG